MDTISVAFRIPVDLVARVDAFAARIAEQTGRVTPVRSDAVRVLLLRGLEVVEAEEKK